MKWLVWNLHIQTNIYAMTLIRIKYKKKSLDYSIYAWTVKWRLFEWRKQIILFIEEGGKQFNTFWHTGYGCSSARIPASPGLDRSQTSSAATEPAPSAEDSPDPKLREPVHLKKKPSPCQSWQQNDKA